MTVWDSPVFPLEWHDPKSGEVSSGYRESGYLPEAVINFLALLGWNPGNDQEVMSMDELIKLFDLHRCSKSGAKFDYKKGIWFNHQYIQQKPNEEIAELFVPVLKEHGVEAPFREGCYCGRDDERPRKFRKGTVGDMQLLLCGSYRI